jgi:hypothetical protein
MTECQGGIMKIAAFLFWALCLGLTLNLTSSTSVLAKGELVGGPGIGCYGGEPKNATFTATRYTYIFSGSCTLLQTRYDIKGSVPWTAVGTYDPATGQAAEDILVPAPRTDQPSRPYGRFQASMHCSADPWLNPNVKCDHIVPVVDAPLDRTAANAKGYRPAPLAPLITSSVISNNRPFTSFMTQDAINSLNRRYGAYEAQHKSDAVIRQLKKNPGILGRGIEQENRGESRPTQSEGQHGSNP